MKSTNTKTGIILSFVSLMLLGIMPTISNSRPTQMSALDFALFLSVWQCVFAIISLLVEFKSSNKGIFAAELSDKIKRKTTIIILSTGALFGISTFAYVLSIEKAGTVSASIAIQSYPLFAILIEAIFLNFLKNKKELLFTFLLIFGLYYLGTNGTWRINGLSVWFLFSLTVPLIWSIAHVIIKEVIDKTPITPIQVTFFRVSMSVVLLSVISFSMNGFNHILTVMKNPIFQMYAAIMGFVYYVELINWFYAVKHINVSLASSITTPWPVVTLILASTFLHEPIEYYQIIAMTIVFISIYGILISGKK